MKKIFTLFSLLVGTVALQAAPAGIITLGICDGVDQGVIVTATSIDWIQPVGGGTGCTQTAAGTNLTFDGGTLTSGVEGTLADLDASNPPPIPNFLLFPSEPNLVFTLTSLGPGLADTTCDDNYSALNQCSVFAGSPFIVRGNEANTTITLAVFGTVTDGTSTSEWRGSFSTEVDETPFELQQLFAPGGQINPDASVQAAYSARLNVTVGEVIPEPGTYAMMVGGGLLLGISAMRRRKKA